MKKVRSYLWMTRDLNIDIEEIENLLSRKPLVVKKHLWRMIRGGESKNSRMGRICVNAKNSVNPVRVSGLWLKSMLQRQRFE